MANLDRRSPTSDGLGTLLEQAEVAPWDWFASLRARGSVVWDEGADAWLAVSYDALTELARRDIEVFAKGEQYNGASEWGRFHDNPPDGVEPERWHAIVERLRYEGNRNADLAMLEGPVHTHQHRWWVNAYSPRVLEGWRKSYINPLAHAQIDTFVEAGRADMVDDLLERVVPRIIAAVVGLPDDPEWVARYAMLANRRIQMKLAVLEEKVSLEFLEGAAAADEEMHEMLWPIVKERRQNPRDDIISMVWRDSDEFFRPDEWGPYSEEDVIHLIHNLTRTGQSTVAASSRNPIYALMTHARGFQDTLRSADDRTMTAFIEECIRLYGSVDIRPRIAKIDTELAGVQIKAGDMVLPMRLAGNRDGAHYACPADIDLTRRQPRDHFGFNRGPRSCPGQGLARMIIQEITRVVLERTRDLRLDPDGPTPRYTGTVMRKWEPLPALFTPA